MKLKKHDGMKCYSIGCQFYNEKMDLNCDANENLCEKCINNQYKEYKYKESKMKNKVNQDRPPNFRGEDGNLFLVRCYSCNETLGTENYVLTVSSGMCAFCGWKEDKEDDIDKIKIQSSKKFNVDKYLVK